MNSVLLHSLFPFDNGHLLKLSLKLRKLKNLGNSCNFCSPLSNLNLFIENFYFHDYMILPNVFCEHFQIFLRIKITQNKNYIFLRLF